MGISCFNTNTLSMYSTQDILHVGKVHVCHTVPRVQNCGTQTGRKFVPPVPTSVTQPRAQSGAAALPALPSPAKSTVLSNCSSSAPQELLAHTQFCKCSLVLISSSCSLTARFHDEHLLETNLGLQTHLH